MTGDPPDQDVIIVGAGLSGIGMAHHLQRLCPWARYRILEAREAIGGTWDLFRYPGVRSDSDMHTLGYGFRPWGSGPAIADGDAIRTYIEETAREAGIDRHIAFGVRVTQAAWRDETASWTLETNAGPLTCRFLIMCAGYYSYAGGHRPHWPGEEHFAGRIVHPQAWPKDLDWSGKRVAVIGSGATAVTLVPALAQQAAHVTMVQRTPSYVAARPSEDRVARWLGRLLPARMAASATRWKNVLGQQYVFGLSRRKPAKVKATLIRLTEKEIGPEQARHFTPAYDPWDQRLCLSPDGDLFAAIRAGTVTMATGAIARFTRDGLAMADGTQVPADIVVTATGLTLEMAGGVRIVVADEPVRLGERMVYKGLMFSGLPNFASIFGYTNASWTLKADLSAAWLCRLLERMKRHGHRRVEPIADPSVQPRPFLDFSSGYIERASAILPQQGDRGPWRLRQNYLADLLALRHGRIDDGILRFGP